MKQRLVILIGVVLLFVVLAALNAATYTQKEKTPDTEVAPNRSTYNSGATGTQAFYTLLAETGRRVTRWQEPPSALLTARARPNVFVVVGPVRRGFEDDAETGHLLRWVSEGGRLVVIDRVPPGGLLTTTANWKLFVTDLPGLDLYSTDPTDGAQMTRGLAAIKPVQPTIFTNSVNAVQPSRFATSIRFALVEHEETTSETPAQYGFGIPTQTPPDDTSGPPEVYTETSDKSGLRAPVVHLAAGRKNLVVDVAYGSGRIVYLTDPYVLSNGGIGLVDNAQLGINLVAMKDALVVFDEFHQGYGSNNNRLLQFFEGTPVVGIFLQVILLAGLVFFSQSRRFARAVPEPEPDRLSKLEYVAAMAELQNRTRAWDLAIENIYTEFRRRAVRAVGVDNTAATKDLAGRIAERTQRDAASIEKTLVSCEEIIRGEPTTKPEILHLTGDLRVIEAKLGISRSRMATK